MRHLVYVLSCCPTSEWSVCVCVAEGWEASRVCNVVRVWALAHARREGRREVNRKMWRNHITRTQKRGRSWSSIRCQGIIPGHLSTQLRTIYTYYWHKYSHSHIAYWQLCMCLLFTHYCVRSAVTCRRRTLVLARRTQICRSSTTPTRFSALKSVETPLCSMYSIC